MDPRIQLFVRNAECTACRMCSQAEGMDRCVTANGSHQAKILVVNKMPWGERQLKEIHTYLERAGFDLSEIAFTSAVKCRTWDMQPNRTTIKACKQFLAQEIEFIKPEWVLALGNEALSAAAGKSGIMKHRGVTYPGPHGSKVVATISPAMVHRNPGQKGGFEADLTYLKALTEGRDLVAEHRPKHFKFAKTKQDLKDLASDIRNAHGVSFDIESTGFDEFAADAAVVCIAFTLWDEGQDTSRVTWALPLFHPESPWIHICFA
jgi:uracil-DNA glycosylase family 4